MVLIHKLQRLTLKRSVNGYWETHRISENTGETGLETGRKEETPGHQG